MPRIFISYRRSDSQTITGRINDRLVQAFGGRNVFKDVDDIPPGVDFRQVIRAALSQRVTVLVIIGPGWLNARDQHGNRRLDDPNDFVRIEIRTALERPDARVIPVLVDGAEMPQSDELPDELRALAFRNAVLIRQDPDFHRDVQRLIRQIQEGQIGLPAPRLRWAFAAALFIVLLVVAGLYALQLGITIGTATPVARGFPSDTPNNLTVAVQNLTATAAEELTRQAPAPTDTPDEVQTLMAEIRASETARATIEPVVTSAETATPADSPTPTANRTATARAARTQSAEDAAYAATSTAEELTQQEQRRENTPTITSLPSRTPTRTPTLTPSTTRTPTVTRTVAPDLTGTADAVRLNETRIYEAALATQTSARATADAGNLIAYYGQPEGISLNVRAEPGGPVIATISPGDYVVIVGETDDGAWSQVRLSDDLTGWSSSSLLTLIGTPTPAPNPTIVFGLAYSGVTRNMDWSPFIRAFDDVPMALVPRGCFVMGSDLVADETPRSRQCIQEPFWIDVHEVSNDQFAAFEGIAVQAADTNGEKGPRNRISWNESRTFCELRGARLPTEAEWEYAARGPGGFTHSWGAQLDILRIPPRLMNFCDSSCDRDWRYEDYIDHYAEAAPVGAYPAGASWVGALDLNGNLWEWVSTAYDTRAGGDRYPYPYNPDDGREDLDAEDALRVVRGGSWVSTLAETRSSNRDRYEPSNRVLDVGFRCARDAGTGS